MPATTATAVEPGAGPRPAPAEAAADEAAVTTLLNCYLRETGTEATGTVLLERLGLELAAPVAYRSATASTPTGCRRPWPGWAASSAPSPSRPATWPCSWPPRTAPAPEPRRSCGPSSRWPRPHAATFGTVRNALDEVAAP